MNFIWIFLSFIWYEITIIMLWQSHPKCYLQHLKEEIFYSTYKLHPNTGRTCLYVFVMSRTLWFLWLWVLPYIYGISQPLTRLVQKLDIRHVVSKPFKTLQLEFPSPKSRVPIDLQPNVVYKIPFAHCPWSHVGETGRCFESKKKRTYIWGMWNLTQEVPTSLTRLDFKWLYWL